MNARRQLIVNADDFGLSRGVNEGVFAAFERGIVTSASLMVRGNAVAQAVRYARENADLDLGLHIDMGEWRWHDNAWRTVYEVVALQDGGAIAAEVERQLHTFHELCKRSPTHIDSHQHVHQRSPAKEAIGAAAAALGVPLRHYTNDIRYCGQFYGQTAEGERLADLISVDALVAIIEHLPPGITELACHPGLDEQLDTMYRTERRDEVETLCDPRVKVALSSQGVTLTRFSRIEQPRSQGPIGPGAMRGPSAKRD